MFSKQTRQKRIRNIIPILKEEYPNAGPRLNFSNPLELLIASILAAQCTDDRVNIVTKDLFKKYKTAQDYLNANIEQLMEEIYSTGTFRRKATLIKECCAVIVQKHNGEVPDNMEDLTNLPGVGRKTANLVLANSFGVPGIIMDTHVIRLSKRIGLTDKNNPDKMEADLLEIVPEKERTDLSNLLMFHGREICLARNPKCEKCRINAFCDYYKETYNNQQKKG